MTTLQKHISLYFGITNENIEKVSSLFIESELKKGDYFIKPGQYCEKLSFIQNGIIRVFAEVNNKEITQWISMEGSFVTDLYSFIFKQRARWSMQALTNCKLYTIPKENYNELNKIIPNWSDLEKKFITNCFTTLEDRVFDHLSLNSEERYNKLFNSSKDLFNKVPLQFLASMLGMSPETLSRIRKKNIS